MKNLAGFAAGVFVGYKGIPLFMHLTYIGIIAMVILTKVTM